MKYKTSRNIRQELAENLIDLPNKIIQNYELTHLTQLVLHSLGHNDCFSLDRAAYFVDNPDFDQLLGAAGYLKEECCYSQVGDLWKDPYNYSQHMKNATFHKKIQEILKTSIKRQNIDFNNSKDLKSLANELEMTNPKFISWNLKYGNHGVLIYEASSGEELLSKAVSLLAFCPVLG